MFGKESVFGEESVPWPPGFFALLWHTERVGARADSSPALFAGICHQFAARREDSKVPASVHQPSRKENVMLPSRI